MKQRDFRYFVVLFGGLIFALGAEKGDSAPQLDEASAPLTSDRAEALAQNTDRHMIIILKNPLTGDGATADQQPLLDELSQVKAHHVTAFRMVNALAATVSEGELARLRANPAVAQVLPDLVIHRAAGPATVQAASAAGSALPLNVIPKACGENGRVLLDPEALDVTHTNSDDPDALTARSLGFTGAGVKVAWIADGIDPQNINFIRADGTSAFVDYQDFSGDGPNAVTDGGEAFLDANAIAGQGLHVYDVSAFSAQIYPTVCNVRIEGMAPGVQLVGLKAFSQANASTQSGFLQAIEYAVNVAKVNVLNESFGSNYFPDETSRDILKKFNDEAVRAGVVVTVSSGDAGSTNTIGTPATDPLILSVGASTTDRYYAQTNYAAARYFATGGWLNNNISSLSSGGYTETGKTIDLVAPGDLGWASCDASATFQGCTDFQNKPATVQRSGGTSMSSPLTAGAAALVIEAYRKAHQGASPSPAQVKQILLSTATDLGVPAVEQGSGLLNTYKAVLLAQAIDDGDVAIPQKGSLETLKQAGQPLLISVNQLNGVGKMGKTFHWPVTVTNMALVAQTVEVAGRTFSPTENVQSGTVTLNDGTSGRLLDPAGAPSNYETFTFTVPAKGADRLNASIAYPGVAASGDKGRVRLILIDPKGRFAAHSLPQGLGDFGNVDVRKPAPGTWTGVIFGNIGANQGTNGTIPWQVSTQAFVPFGSVYPSGAFLAPGASATFMVRAKAPDAPGDSSGSIVVSSSAGGKDLDGGYESSSVPVTLRSLVDVKAGGAFTGILTGGNGRASSGGQVNYFQFKVAPGHKSLMANVSLTNDAGTSVGAYLVNPNGIAVGFGQNTINGTNSLSLTASALAPVAGNWTLIVDFASVVGNEVSQQFTGNIQLDTIDASAPQLPSSPSVQLAANTPVIVPVTITNNGPAPLSVFLDARLDTETPVALAAIGLPSGFQAYALPLSPTAPAPQWLVPTQTSSLHVAAQASAPFEFDYQPATGDPDLFGAPDRSVSGQTSFTASSTYTPKGGIVSPGFWSANPSEIGPFPAGEEPSAQATVVLTATIKAFDAALTSPTGDLWLTALNAAYSQLAAVTVNPGESTVINVTITPSGPSGTVVCGTLYVDDSVPQLPPFGQTTGSELTALHYAYTIK